MGYQRQKIELFSHAMNKIKRKWSLDNGCLKHLIGDQVLLSSFKIKDGGRDTFGDSAKEKSLALELKKEVTLQKN